VAIARVGGRYNGLQINRPQINRITVENGGT
jgi:hypothetical protein